MRLIFVIFRKTLRIVLFCLLLNFSSMFLFDLNLFFYIKEYFDFVFSTKETSLNQTEIIKKEPDPNFGFGPDFDKPMPVYTSKFVPGFTSKQGSMHDYSIDENPLNEGVENPVYAPGIITGHTIDETGHNYMLNIPYNPLFDVDSEDFIGSIQYYPYRNKCIIELFKYHGLLPENFGRFTYKRAQFFEDLRLDLEKTIKRVEVDDLPDYTLKDFRDDFVVISLIVIILSWCLDKD